MLVLTGLLVVTRWVTRAWQVRAIRREALMVSLPSLVRLLLLLLLLLLPHKRAAGKVGPHSCSCSNCGVAYSRILA